MARPLWTGAVSFGLVTIPVKLFSATAPKSVRFHQVHDKDGGRIRMKRVCSLDGEEIPYEHVIKGFALAKNRTVTLTEEELSRFDPKATHSIDIQDFVPSAQIDPIYFETTYFVAPDRGAARPYALLLAAMRESGRVGIAQVVMRTKGYLCALRPYGDALTLTTLLYADEVVDAGELEALPGKAAKPHDKELKMALQLVEALADDFDPRKYKDEHREKVLDLIEQKAAGEAIDEPAAPKPSRGPVDLLAALQQSLRARDDQRASKPAVRAAPRRRSRGGAHPAAGPKRTRSRRART